MKIGSGFKAGFKWSFKPFVNVHDWIGLRTIKTISAGLISAIKMIFVPQQAERQESYDEAIKRLNLSAEDIEERKRSFFRIALSMAGFGIICLVYMLYLLWSGSLAAGCIAFIVSLIVFAYAYRFHFWWFQLKNKKLGCTFQEWLNSKVSGED